MEEKRNNKEKDPSTNELEPSDDVCKSRSKNLVRNLMDRNLGIGTSVRASTADFESIAETNLVFKEYKESICSLPGQPRATFLMVFSPDGTKVASTHGNHSIYVTDLRTGKNIRTLWGHPRTPWCIAFHPWSNDILASGCLGGQVRVWDLCGGSEVWVTESETVIASLAFHPTKRLLVIATYNEIHFWDWSKQEPFAVATTLNEEEKVRYVAFNKSGEKLITGIANLPKKRRTQWDQRPCESYSTQLRAPFRRIWQQQDPAGVAESLRNFLDRGPESLYRGSGLVPGSRTVQPPIPQAASVTIEVRRNEHGNSSETQASFGARNENSVSTESSSAESPFLPAAGAASTSSFRAEVAPRNQSQEPSSFPHLQPFRLIVRTPSIYAMIWQRMRDQQNVSPFPSPSASQQQPPLSRPGPPCSSSQPTTSSTTNFSVPPFTASTSSGVPASGSNCEELVERILKNVQNHVKDVVETMARESGTFINENLGSEASCETGNRNRIMRSQRTGCSFGNDRSVDGGRSMESTTASTSSDNDDILRAEEPPEEEDSLVNSVARFERLHRALQGRLRDYRFSVAHPTSASSDEARTTSQQQNARTETPASYPFRSTYGATIFFKSSYGCITASRIPMESVNPSRPGQNGSYDFKKLPPEALQVLCNRFGVTLICCNMEATGISKRAPNATNVSRNIGNPMTSENPSNPGENVTRVADGNSNSRAEIEKLDNGISAELGDSVNSDGADRSSAKPAENIDGPSEPVSDINRIRSSTEIQNIDNDSRRGINDNNNDSHSKNNVDDDNPEQLGDRFVEGNSNFVVNNENPNEEPGTSKSTNSRIRSRRSMPALDAQDDEDSVDTRENNSTSLTERKVKIPLEPVAGVDSSVERNQSSSIIVDPTRDERPPFDLFSSVQGKQAKKRDHEENDETAPRKKNRPEVPVKQAKRARSPTNLPSTSSTSRTSHENFNFDSQTTRAPSSTLSSSPCSNRDKMILLMLTGFKNVNSHVQSAGCAVSSSANSPAERTTQCNSIGTSETLSLWNLRKEKAHAEIAKVREAVDVFRSFFRSIEPKQRLLTLIGISTVDSANSDPAGQTRLNSEQRSEFYRIFSPFLQTTVEKTSSDILRSLNDCTMFLSSQLDNDDNEPSTSTASAGFFNDNYSSTSESSNERSSRANVSHVNVEQPSTSSNEHNHNDPTIEALEKIRDLSPDEIKANETEINANVPIEISQAHGDSRNENPGDSHPPTNIQRELTSNDHTYSNCVPAADSLPVVDGIPLNLFSPFVADAQDPSDTSEETAGSSQQETSRRRIVFSFIGFQLHQINLAQRYSRALPRFHQICLDYQSLIADNCDPLPKRRNTSNDEFDPIPLGLCASSRCISEICAFLKKLAEYIEKNKLGRGCPCCQTYEFQLYVLCRAAAMAEGVLLFLLTKLNRATAVLDRILRKLSATKNGNEAGSENESARNSETSPPETTLVGPRRQLFERVWKPDVFGQPSGSSDNSPSGYCTGRRFARRGGGGQVPGNDRDDVRMRVDHPPATVLYDGVDSKSYRVQVWDFSEAKIPNVTNPEKNVVVKACKIHNDASIDISSDGTLLATLLPPTEIGEPFTLGVYSLHWESLGRRLHSVEVLENQTVVSLSLSPTKEHLLVGLAPRRFLALDGPLPMALIYKLVGPTSDAKRILCLTREERNYYIAVNARSLYQRLNSSLKVVDGALILLRKLQRKNEMVPYYVSINCIRWAPQPGQGMVYATSIGQLNMLH